MATSLVQFGLEGSSGTVAEFLLAVFVLVGVLLAVRLLGGVFDRVF